MISLVMLYLNISRQHGFIHRFPFDFYRNLRVLLISKVDTLNPHSHDSLIHEIGLRPEILGRV